MGQTVFRGLLGFVCLLTTSVRVEADYYTDFTLGGTAWINHAYFEATTTGSGTGSFPAFIQASGGNDNGTNSSDTQPVSEAYNTTANVLDNANTATFNHSIQVKDIPIAYDANGKAFFEFLWDINEPNSDGTNWLSLDALRIFSSPTVNNPSYTSVSELAANTTERYDMNQNGINHILFDFDQFAGSGKSDLRVYIPVWAGADPDDYVYLYSMQGAVALNQAPGANYDRDFAQSGGGFEEWGLRTGTSNLPPDIPVEPQGGVVPEPTSLALAGFAGIGLALRALRRRRSQKTDQAA